MAVHVLCKKRRFGTFRSDEGIYMSPSLRALDKEESRLLEVYKEAALLYSGIAIKFSRVRMTLSNDEYLMFCQESEAARCRFELAKRALEDHRRLRSTRRTTPAG